MALLRLGIKSVRAHPARLILTGLAVVAGVAFVTGSFVISDSLKSVFGTLVSDANADVDARVQPEEIDFGDGATVSDSLPAELEALPEVEAAFGVVAPYEEESFNPFVALDDEGNQVVPEGPPVLSFSWIDDPQGTIGGVEISEGRAPEQYGEMVLLDAYATALGAQVGDTISVVTLNDGVQDFEMVGVVTFEASGGAWFILFDLESAQQLYGREGELSTISLRSAPGVSTDDLVAVVADELPNGIEVIDAQTAIEQDTAEFEGIINIFRNILLAFAIVALFVSLFIIYNTFKILVTQRIREFGVLRAVGATAGQLTLSVVIEAAFLGLMSSIVGLLAGIGVAQLITALLKATGGFPDTSTVLTSQTVIIAFVVGIGATVFASLVPAWSARRISPVEAMRNEGLPSGGRRPRLIIGTICTVLGVVGLGLGLFGGGSTSTVLTWLGIGALLTFLGAALLSELFGGPMVNVIGSRTGRRVTSVLLIVGGLGLVVLGINAVSDGSFVGIGTALLGVLGAAAGVFLASNAFSSSQLAGDLARQNAVRNPDRTASTATALMIGLALVTTVSVMGQSLKATFSEALTTSINADLYIFSDTDSFSSSLTTEIAALDGVEEVGEFTDVPVQYVTDDVVGAVTTFDTRPGEDLVRFGLEDDASPIDDGSGVWASATSADERGWARGDTIELRFEDQQTQAFTIAGLFDDDAVVSTDLIIDRQTVLEHYDDLDVDFGGVRLADGADPEATKAAAQALADDVSGVNVLDTGEIRDQANSQIDALLLIVNGLLAFTLVVALIGIINTIALSVSERTREIGLLRAVGMTRTQLARSIRWEAVMVSVFGALLGIALGVLFAYAAIQAIPAGIINEVSVPWVTLGTIVMLAAVLGVLAAVIPGWSAGRKNILAAIASE